jgi:hypothetical protein
MMALRVVVSKFGGIREELRPRVRKIEGPSRRSPPQQNAAEQRSPVPPGT